MTSTEYDGPRTVKEPEPPVAEVEEVSKCFVYLNRSLHIVSQDILSVTSDDIHTSIKLGLITLDI